MKHNYETSEKTTRHWEGGYVNHKSDRGGETNFGITSKTYAYWQKLNPAYGNMHLKDINLEHAKLIFEVLYYEPIRFDDLPDGIDIFTVDYAINSGHRLSVKHLQRALNLALPSRRFLRARRPLLKEDGLMGPQTLQRSRLAWKMKKAEKVIEEYAKIRLTMMKYIKDPNGNDRPGYMHQWATFGTGWTKRVNNVERTAISAIKKARGIAE